MQLATPLEEKMLLDGARLVRVKDEAGISDAAAVNREAYQSLAFSAEAVDAIYGRPGRALESQLGVYVVYRGDEPVSTATLLQSAGVGGIYWVGTREAWRGKGYAEACTRAVANAGFEAGARVIALQATRMGEPLYRRLGFRIVGAHRWLLATAARAISALVLLEEQLLGLPLPV
jgi:ribosomal protein S18 acetylase RimI-like enzyme